MTSRFAACRLPALAAALVALSACVSATPPAVAPSGPAPKLPGRVVWTDGHNPIAVAQAGSAICPATSAAMAAQGLAATNAQRRAAGLPPLAGNRSLDAAAAAHACDMARRGTMTHQGTTTSGPMARAKAHGYRPQLIAENIAAGRFEISGVLAQWNASPKHRENIEIPSMRDFGIGMATAADGKTTFWTAVYAK
ncbi:CAP domain-containing protein [Rhodobacter lacus]|uniref:CAP domain-containing protein n=1 Tax=Rhodobacter lacus TaxID=1641972 RepID=A0ABW5AC55_9RHOB